MTISYVNVGTRGDQGTAGVAQKTFVTKPGWPSPITAGNLLVAVLRLKPANLNIQSMGTVEGFACVGWTIVGGGSTQGADTGQTTISFHVRVADGNEATTFSGGPGIRIYGSQNAEAVIFQLSKTAAHWAREDFDVIYGIDTSAGAAMSATLNSGFVGLEGGQPTPSTKTINLAAGDMCVYAGAVPTDAVTGYSGESLTMSGVTFGSFNRVQLFNTATGTDGGGFVDTVPVTAGSGTGTVTASVTAAGTTTNVAGPLALLRVRETSTAPALPAKITAHYLVEPESHTGIPPFLDDNGNIYRWFEHTALHDNTANTPVLYVSRDGGYLWEEVDPAGGPSAGFDVEALTSLRVASTDQILMSFTKDSDAYFYALYDLSSATTPGKYIRVDEVIDTGMTASGMHQWMTMVRRSDGSLPMFYSDTFTGGNHRIGYKIRTGAYNAAGTYSTKVSLDATASVAYTGPQAVLGASDTTHVLYCDKTNNRVLYKSLSSANVLTPASATVGTVASTSTLHASAYGVVLPVYTSEAGTEVISYAYPTTGTGVENGVLKFRQMRGGVWQTEETITSDVLVNPAAAVGEAAVAFLTVDPSDNTIHAVWTDQVSGDVFMRSRSAGASGTWGTATKIQDLGAGFNADWLYGQLYTRAGSKVIGYTYHYGPQPDDTGVNFYAEQAVGSTPPSTTPVTASRSTTWAVRASVTDAQATTWAVRAATTATRSSTWAVRTRLTATRATTWAVRTALTATRSSTWATRTVVTASRASSWAVRTRATASRATTWGVRQSVAATRATTWKVRSLVTASRATSWAVRARATATRATNWAVRTSVTASRATLWNVAGTLAKVTASRATTWAVRAQATATRSTTWKVRALVTSTRSSTWAVRVRLTATRATSWAVRARLTATRATTWKVRSRVTGLRATTWKLRSLVTATVNTVWQTFGILPRDITFYLSPPRLDWEATVAVPAWDAKVETFQWEATLLGQTWDAAVEGFAWAAAAPGFTWAASVADFIWAAGPPDFD